MLPNAFLTILAAMGIANADPEQPIEPIDVPPSVEQGVDMVYVDPEIAPVFQRREIQAGSFDFRPWTGAPVDMFMPVHPLYTELRRGLVKYRQRWAGLPDIAIPQGPALKAGA